MFLFFCEIFLQNALVGYRGINNKGVMDRPWTIWKVLMAISSTLKCQFTGKHENGKIWLVGETEHRRPGPIKLRNVFPLTSVAPKPPPTAIWCKQILCLTSFFVFTIVPNSLLGSAQPVVFRGRVQLMDPTQITRRQRTCWTGPVPTWSHPNWGQVET